MTFALFALLATAGAQTASACVSPAFAPLPLSTFEGADGDQCDSDGVGLLRDWQNVASDPGLTSTVDAPSNNDTMYGSNNAGIVGGPTDETVPDSWNFTTGNLGGGKFDALAASSFTDPENGKLFLDLGFVRATTSGDTFLAFELNQRQPGYRLDPNEDDPANPFAVPTRTAGDLLVTYHVGTGGANTLGLCVWDGDEHSGEWEEFSPDLSGAVITNQSCPMLSIDLYQAAINDGQGGRQGAIPGTENYLDPGTAISAGQFGEAVVNLTDALRDPINPDGPQPCVDFGYVWLHSRSSDSLTSNQQDFILPPSAVSIGNCSVEGSKFNDLDGDGSRSVGEPFLAGWTIFVDYDGDGVLDNNMDATFVNDFDGIVEAGEEEPFDVTADGTGTEPLGFYRITKIQPSNVGNPAGTWPIREILQPTWDCTAAVGGGAVLLPNVCPEDTSTNPDSALGFRLAWTDNDEIYTGRDFGNRRQPANLTVIKHVVNDDGGSAAAGAWSLHVTNGGTDVAGSPQPGDEAGDTYALTHGQSYNVSETGGPSGYAASYSGDCNASGDVTVTAGQTKTCTITNNDIAPKLTVIKHVINDNGGTQTASNFTITVNDPGTDPPSFPGAASPGTDVTVDPGAYTVTEGPHAGYAVSYSADCDSSLAIGQTKTCTVTNNDIAPKLIVIKNVVNDSGGTQTASSFTITVNDPGTDPPSFPGAASPGTDVTVDPGAYTVTEGPHAGYTVSYSADCDSSLAIGQTKTCTVTNDDIAPKLIVIKTVINDNGGTQTASNFQITVDDPGTDPPSFPGAASPGTDVTVDPGPYTVTEGPHAGYAVTYSPDCDSSLAIGHTKTCTVTNNDIAPKLIVIKNVVNDNGGTQTASSSTITVDDPGTDPPSFPGAASPGTDVTVDPGDYTVTEGPHAGYTVSYSADCDSSLAIGQTKTCTVTNNDIAPKLIVIKTVINDNGGTQTASNFQITVDDPGTDPPSFPGAGAPGTDVTVDPGDYTVTEDPHAGYTVSYSPDCDSSLAIGQTKTCTVTNNDIAPKLIVIKNVVNDNGGTQTASNFQITVDDPGTNPPSFPGAGAPGTDVTVDPGAYTVTEGPHPGYTVSYSPDCDSSLAIGQTKTCTVTNNDIAPKLIVIKNVVNDNGGTQTASSFTISVNDPGTDPPSFPGAGAPGTDVTVDPGDYTVTEGPHAGYTVSYSADCDSSLAIGQTKTCTVTNDDIAPKLIVIKNVVNNNGGTKTAGDFTITVDDPGTNPPSFPGTGAPGTDVTVDPGDYTVTEGPHAGYAVTYSTECDDTLAIGETKTCTVTNDDIAATLTVIKHVINDDGGTKSADDFEITVDDPGTNPASFPGAESPGTLVAVDPGAYTVSEGDHDGYAVTYSAGCTGTVAIGATSTCTVTNDDIAPTLTVIKTVVNKNGSTATAADFTMHIDGTAGTETFPGAATPGTTKTLNAGSYDVTETGAATANYTESKSAGCTGTLAVGDAKTCTITNTRKAGTITVVKDLIPSADSGRFNLRIDGNVVRANAGDGDGSAAVEVNTGTHTVSEVAGNAGALADYVSSIACSNGASAAGTGPLDVAVTSGANITCTVTNTRKATVTVRKVTETADATTQFAFSSGLPATAGPPAIAANGSFSLTDGTQVTTKVAAGTYPVSENDPQAQGYKLTGLSCTESATQNTTVATGDAIATARNATINAEAGETITCTFTNRKIVAQPIVVKAGDTIAYHGDVVSYSFSVTNTGNTPLHNVAVSDDKCPNVSAAPTSKTNDDGDALLEPIGVNGTTPEVWVYTCSYTIGAHQPGEANPVVNTATVSALDEFDRPVGDTDQHATRLLHQSISIDKTGPASALAGSLVTYELAVANSGDIAFAGPLVILADARCEAPPVRVSAGADTSPGSLDPGDVWRYTCSVQTAVGQTSVHNVASVDGTDTNGRKATDEDDATTTLTQPVAPPLPPTVGVSEPVKPVALFPASARLRGASGCMPAVARFYVTGTRIAKVRFTVDGKHERFVSKKDSKGRYVYTLRRKITTNGVHMVEARITFLPGSALQTKTLRATFQKCRREIRPTFTG